MVGWGYSLSRRANLTSIPDGGLRLSANPRSLIALLRSLGRLGRPRAGIRQTHRACGTQTRCYYPAKANPKTALCLGSFGLLSGAREFWFKREIRSLSARVSASLWNAFFWHW